MGVSKNNGTPQMDGLFHGKPYYIKSMIWGPTPIFWLTPIYHPRKKSVEETNEIMELF